LEALQGFLFQKKDIVIAATDPAKCLFLLLFSLANQIPFVLKPMATFRFAEDDVQAEEVQVRIFIADTGPESRLNRRGAEKEPALADKNGCLVADATMLG
jgi:hypothetical protein